jgi:ankyrin repeat protein
MGGDSALVAAAANGYAREVEALIDAGGSPDARLSASQLVLGSRTHKQLGGPLSAWPVQARLAQGDKEQWAYMPLHCAAFNGRADVVALLIQKGASVNAKAFGASPLHWAIGANKVETARLLITAGADVDSLAGGWTPLHRAAGWGNPDMVRLLLGAGARPDVLDNNGATALDVAVVAGASSIVDLLKDGGSSGLFSRDDKQSGER